MDLPADAGTGSSDVVRLAVWSGPRNISTALMRSWGNRTDTIVCDEPLYAHYLQVTGVEHPGAAEILAAHETDWRKVVARLTGPVPAGVRIFYQKHMAHHLLADIDRGWLSRLVHCFLIRDPGEMVPSLTRVFPHATLADTALPQQFDLFEHVRAGTGSTPIVVDARDVLERPREILAMWTEAVGVAFDDCMLSWPAGPRATDGAWAEHWYEQVNRTTGFQPYAPKRGPLSAAQEALAAECRPYYEALYSHRLGR